MDIMDRGIVLLNSFLSNANCSAYKKLNLGFSQYELLFRAPFSDAIEDLKSEALPNDIKIYQFTNNNIDENICIGSVKDCISIVESYIDSHPEMTELHITGHSGVISYECDS